MLEKISLLLTKSAQVWSLLLFGLLLLASLLVQTKLPMDGTEMAQMQATSPLFWLLFLLSLILIFCLLRDLPKLRSLWLFVIGSVIYITLATVLISQVTWILRDDARAVYEAALAINQGDYGSLLVDGYLYRYPHQLGLVTYERLLLALGQTTSTKFLFYSNLLLILASNALTWKVTDLLFGRRSVTNLVIILSFLFLPQLFFILFAYGLVPGLFFSLLAFYSFLRFRENGRAWQAGLFLLSIVLAYLIRNNYIILTISFAIIALLEGMKQRRYWTLGIVVGSLALSLMANAGLTSYYQNLSKTDLSGEPKIAWVTMGLNDRPIYNRVAGWYDAYVETVYAENDGDFKKIEEQSRQDLSERLSYMTSHWGYTYTFFKNKIVSTWTDGLFQSIWSGPVKKQGQTVSGALAETIYEGKTGYNIAYMIGHLVLVLIYLGVFLSLIFLLAGTVKDNFAILIPFVYLSGGFLFHLIWETKSQYVYPYIFLTLPLAAFGLIKSLEGLKSRFFKKANSDQR